MTAKEYRELASTKLRTLIYECVTNQNPIVPKDRADEVIDYLTLASIKGIEENLLTEPDTEQGAASERHG